MGERTAFFYGTLMVPSILQRVTALPSIKHLQIHAAILPDHSRRHVRYVDYPGVIACEGSSVRGTYVSGLTDRDVSRLDVFEGGQYVRRKVVVRLIAGDDNGEKLGVRKGKGKGKGKGGEGETREAETYIFIHESDLEEKEWDYEEFKRKKMSKWVGDSNEYDDLSDDDDEEEEEWEEAGDVEGEEEEDIVDKLDEKEKKEVFESAV